MRVSKERKSNPIFLKLPKNENKHRHEPALSSPLWRNQVTENCKKKLKILEILIFELNIEYENSLSLPSMAR